MSVKTIFIKTSAGGAYTYERNFKAAIRAIELEIGDLSTPDIAVSDDTYSKSILSVAGVAASTRYVPSAFLEAADGTTAALVGTGMKGAGPAICMGVLKVAVTGGGANKRGRLNILYD